ncbi:MAG: hypothetical protein HY016_11415 [Nitrosomonadales bacterium]|nr:hypothetical protein [Nitrosomonadales bacterium]
MQKYFPDNPRQIISILLMVVTGGLALFYWQGYQGLSFFDEGFLWYGAQRTMLGEVPMRDFMAYDIGRYYWSAAFMGLFNDHGIVALRAASTVFQVIALYAGLTALVRGSVKQSRMFWLLGTITLVAWMAPQFRLFDASLAILLVGSIAFLIEQPSRRSYFLGGLVLGLVAVFGRNHALYGVLGSFGAMVYLAVWRGGGANLAGALTSWVLGITVGYLPVLVFLVVVPGFAQAFLDSLLLWFEIKATNLPLPVPWPWLVPFGHLSTSEMLRSVTKGIFFIAIIVFGITGIIWLIRQKMQNRFVSPVLVAAILLTLPYAHYAYSRADLAHLAPAIPPFVIGILALLANQSAKIKWSWTVLFCGASLLVMLPTHPRWYCAVYANPSCIDIMVSGDKLRVDRGMAGNWVELNKLADRYAPGERTFIAAPFWPGAYAALGRKAPMWEIYILFPRSVAFQLAEIERIKAANPGFVVIDDYALDGREDLRFRNSHPVIEQYIRDNFEPLVDPARNPAFQIYRSRQ